LKIKFFNIQLNLPLLLSWNPPSCLYLGCLSSAGLIDNSLPIKTSPSFFTASYYAFFSRNSTNPKPLGLPFVGSVAILDLITSPTSEKYSFKSSSVVSLLILATKTVLVHDGKNLFL
jgi:hypothetical protein